jgi:hypothetical protein
MLMDIRAGLEINTLGTIGLSQVAGVFPVPIVKDCLERTEHYTCRARELPNELMFYFPMMMALDRDDSASETLQRLLEGHENVFGRRTDKVTGKGGISQGRIRVGYEPLKLAFDELCKPVASEVSLYSHYEGLLLCAIDGVVINVLDTQANSDFFGRPKNQKNTEAAFPQARIVAIVECGTHAIVSAEIGKHSEGEVTLARKVLERLPSRVLLTADRLYLGWRLVRQAIGQGAELLWRLKVTDKDRFETIEQLQDGSCRALYHPPKDRKSLKELAGVDLTPIEVRVCSYTTGSENAEDVHLVTTLLDETKFSASKLAELYMQRWEIELVFKEMKVDINKNQPALRSQRPDLVKQELYGIMMMHYAIRSLIYQAAARAKLDPDVISFKAALKVIKRKSLLGDRFSP